MPETEVSDTVGVTHHPALWSPDFPPVDLDEPPAIVQRSDGKRLAGSRGESKAQAESRDGAVNLREPSLFDLDRQLCTSLSALGVSTKHSVRSVTKAVD